MDDKAIHTQAVRIYQDGAYRDVQVTVYVDLAGIARQLAHKAVLNKSGRARFMHGDVLVEYRCRHAGTALDQRRPKP